MAMTDTVLASGQIARQVARQDARLALALALATGLAGGLGFAGYALFGGDVLTSMIETTMMWCL
jgi:hypothetical protein